jgi:hypothetical protein
MQKIIASLILTMTSISGVLSAYGYEDTTKFYDEWGF